MMTLPPRQATIVELLRQCQSVSVHELAARFAVSEMTIRRDLRALESRKLLIRTHGGGVTSSDQRFLESSLANDTPSAAKVAIGRMAAGLVQPGQSLMVDAGTTSLEVARHLPHDINLAVATPSLCAALELFQTPINVTILGGTLRKDFPALYGPLAERVLELLHVDMLFIGCDGAHSEEGFYINNVQHASLVQGMMRTADRVVLVTESSKFASAAFIRYAAVEAIHLLVTDRRLAEVDRMALAASGVTVLIADEETSHVKI
jgi:DeoR/GlpR family transcriptional regulator of sugar metabolism